MRKLKREYQDKNIQSLLEDSLRDSEKLEEQPGKVVNSERIEEIEMED